MRFFVDLNKLKHACADIEEIAGCIDNVRDMIEENMNGLRALDMPEVDIFIEKICYNLIKEEQNLRKLYEAGIAVINRYNSTEKDITSELKPYIDYSNLSEEEIININEKINQIMSEHTVYLYGYDRCCYELYDKNQKDELIRLFESIHPDFARNMNECLKPLLMEGYIDDVRNIKMIAYTAPEPYRSFLLENIKMVKISSLHDEEGKTQNYNYIEGGISINVDTWDSDVYYSVFFHESVHMIDDLLCNGKGNGAVSEHYRNEGKGMSLNDVLQKDIKNDIYNVTENNICDYPFTEVEKMVVQQKIASAIMNCADSTTYNPVFMDVKVGDKVVLGRDNMYQLYKKVCLEIRDSNSKISSDIYGGFSGDLLMNGYGHSVVAYGNEDVSYYWIEGDASTMSPKYDSNGNIEYSGKQEAEFFAEVVSAQITGKPSELSSMDGKFFESTKYVEEMIQNMKEGTIDGFLQ